MTTDAVAGQAPRTLPRSGAAVNVTAWERGFVLESRSIFTPNPGASPSDTRKHKFCLPTEGRKNITQNTCVALALRDVPPCLRARGRITGRKPLVVGNHFHIAKTFDAPLLIPVFSQLGFFFFLHSVFVFTLFWFPPFSCVFSALFSASLPPVKTCRPALCDGNSLSWKRGKEEGLGVYR